MKSRLRILWEGILDVLGGEDDDYCLTVNLLTPTHKEDDYLFHHNERPKLEDVVKGYEDDDFCISIDIFPYSYGVDTGHDRLGGAIWFKKGLELLDVSISLEKFLNELEEKNE